MFREGSAHFWFGWFALKSRFRRFGAMLKLWLLSVVALNFFPFHRNAVRVASIGQCDDAQCQSQVLSILPSSGVRRSCPETSGTVLGCGRQHNVSALLPTGRARTQGAVASWVDVQNRTQAVHRYVVSVFFKKGKPHLLLSAKNTSPLSLGPMALSMTTLF